MKYIFGPVNSRRLGVSLGVDIVPFKFCSFNCIYCECGSTTVLTDEVREYVPFDEVAAEIRQVLDTRPPVDVVTFSGSGEPLLNSRIGDLIKLIKTEYPDYRVAVLTNSSLLYRNDVRHRLLDADVIYPSLDAVSVEVFNKIMRPIEGTDPQKIVDSIVRLREEFKGLLCLEVFIIEGINDTEDELSRLKEAVIRIGPDEIHLNHLDRTGAEEWVKPADARNLERIKDFFKPFTIKIAQRVQGGTAHYFDGYEKCVLDAISEGGSSAEELAQDLNIRLFDVLRALKNLQKKNKVEKISGDKMNVYNRVK